MPRFDAQLNDLTRMNNSESGNPRWFVVTNQGRWFTVPDSDKAVQDVAAIDYGRLPAQVRITLTAPAHRGTARVAGIDLIGYGPKET